MEGSPDPELLRRFTRYIWWKTPEDALRYPQRLCAQVMDIGTFEDMQALVASAGEAYLCQVLAQAEPGQFRPQSWSYWHYRLGLTPFDADVPPRPARRFGCRPS